MSNETRSVLTIAGYLLLSTTLGILSARRKTTANDFLNATGSFPTWVATLSFLAYNFSAVEVIGLSGIALRYGVQAFQFYWIGAIPALIFFALVVLPIYHRSGARSVPEYFGLRFGPGVRRLNTVALLVSSAMVAGASLYSLTRIMQVTAGWRFLPTIAIFSTVTLLYILIGGIRAAVYNEILQFLMMVCSLAPLLYFSRQEAALHPLSIVSLGHLWRDTPIASHTAPLDLVSILIGLGFAISFSYWCTDFGLVQRALMAPDLEAARRVPLLAGFGKLLLSFVLVLPVLLFKSRLTAATHGALDNTSPTLLRIVYGEEFFSIAIAGLVAGLVNCLAGSISAFASLWTQELYRISVRPARSESHYIAIGRLSSAACMLLALLGALASRRFENVSQAILLIFSLFSVPFFALLIFGMFSRRTSPRSLNAAVGFGVIAGASARLSFAQHWLPTGSPLAATFYTAIISLTATLAGAALLTRKELTDDTRPVQRQNLFASLPPLHLVSSTWLLAVILLAACAALNAALW